MKNKTFIIIRVFYACLVRYQRRNLSIQNQNARSENRTEICPRSENKQDIRICYNMKYT